MLYRVLYRTIMGLQCPVNRMGPRFSLTVTVRSLRPQIRMCSLDCSGHMLSQTSELIQLFEHRATIQQCDSRECYRIWDDHPLLLIVDSPYRDDFLDLVKLAFRDSHSRLGALFVHRTPSLSGSLFHVLTSRHNFLVRTNLNR